MCTNLLLSVCLLSQTAIDDYLTDQLTGGATATTADDDEDPAESPKPKRQRTAAAATAATAGSSNEGAPEGGIMLDTQGLKWASLNTFKGHQFINIRNYYRVRQMYDGNPCIICYVLCDPLLFEIMFHRHVIPSSWS